MSARVVNFCHTVVMAGLDHHNGLYYCNLFTGLSPGPPAPPMPYPTGLGLSPFTLHLVYVTPAGAQFGAFLKEDKKNPTVLANALGPIVSRQHECRGNHLPPGGNLMLIPIQYSSSSKWFLGVSSVIAKEGPIASTIDGACGANLNCGDPASSFISNAFFAPGTVEVQPTPEDWAKACFEWAFTAVAEVGVSIGFGKLSNLVKPWVNRLPWGRVASWLVWRTAEAQAEAAERAAADGVKRAIGKGASEAEAKAAADAAAAEAKRLMEEGVPPEKAAGQAASKAAGDYMDKTKPNAPLQEKKDAVTEAGEHAAQSYRLDPGTPEETVPGVVGEGVTGDGVVKPAAGEGTKAAQEWAEQEGGAQDGGHQ